jgi:copper chaperone
MLVELSVEKMKCGGCSANVENIVKAEDAFAQVEVDLAEKRVRIESEVPAERMVKAISDAGFPARVIA